MNLDPNYAFQILMIVFGAAGVLGVLGGIYLLLKRITGGSTEITFEKFGSIRTTEVGAVTVFFGLFLCLSSVIAYSKTESLTFERAKLDNLTVRAAEILRRHYDRQDFATVKSIADFILEAEPYNGHALYFAGEAERALGATEKSQKFFFRYLEAEAALSEDRRAGGLAANLCYQRPKGYCQQRTAWIHHLLANIFYAKGRQERDGKTKQLYFQKAADQITLVWRLFPGGFIQDTAKTDPTEVLERNVQRELKALREAAG